MKDSKIFLKSLVFLSWNSLGCFLPSENYAYTCHLIVTLQFYSLLPVPSLSWFLTTCSQSLLLLLLPLIFPLPHPLSLFCIYFTFSPLSFCPLFFPLTQRNPNNDFESQTLLVTLIAALNSSPRTLTMIISFILNQPSSEGKNFPMFFIFLGAPVHPGACLLPHMFYSAQSPMEQRSSLLGI